ncbi:Ldh family oxidoreductase [Patescibacteria group bacterium]|nr:Ldh family oxidoreductase [Patescibacteria group bacterium]MBU1967349.1 Ldh family oxidoreductase [Patescibacteria group bacterium]MBU2543280.1 Ldh family oxidoreductase [Patescibacteria group bacterium]
MKIKLTELEELSKKALKKYGYTEQESEVILDMLMYAQLRGNNQGIVKLIGRGIPKHEKAKTPTIEKETPTTALINANLTMEAIAMDQAVEMVIKKAKLMGIAIVGTHNGAGSSGAIGYWSRKVADAGLIGITMSSYPIGSVPPHGSYEPLFCTNPIAWGIPTKDEPIVLDMASASIAYYGLVEAKTEGRKLLAKLGYDKNGNETNDPGEIMEGATKPFDHGFKGAGLAMMVQIIGGALVGADFLNGSDNDGNVIIAINPESLAGTDRFFNEVTKMIRATKGAKRLEGVNEIFVPGERGDKTRAEILKSGEIEVGDNLYSELRKVASQA